ncbi:hypothetical protein SERLA73DRAFT_72898 [Serpula lacrymans var. lacrymans S7.3]|uniref:Uncharacterized protein n=2 Tax=Serpula lacrymans var. lacrymans TaxID=341189 RepID=F8PVF0_SERL3|nr:uncharacterized protein SERLADRAFT_437446 [Serpula lacrymans var. lacrymans S7.9]EGO00160.1 hypothetical protein SERLA73DRAFT_72898 [Serpula lacrymans var. lacrymans S7.3]EGO25721.1 hypothetical protein SERLADRAFT_437446 [Serpula lacrymans var. lacrymans S7.9]
MQELCITQGPGRDALSNRAGVRQGWAGGGPGMAWDYERRVEARASARPHKHIHFSDSHQSAHLYRPIRTMPKNTAIQYSSPSSHSDIRTVLLEPGLPDASFFHRGRRGVLDFTHRSFAGLGILTICSIHSSNQSKSPPPLLV